MELLISTPAALISTKSLEITLPSIVTVPVPCVYKSVVSAPKGPFIS